MRTMTLGAVEITRIVEWHAPAAAPITEIFPDSTPRMWRENESWLAPDFWDPGTDRLGVAVQTWLLRNEGRTILVDTGLGNDKERPDRPVWSRLRGDFLERLAAVGVRPEDVDVVVNTHLHADHVGWNTRLVAGEWVPTFPNATYLVPRADFEHWARPEAAAGPAGAAFADSVLPVRRAGQAVLWDGSDGEYRIDGSLALAPAPGHTPGSSVLRLASGTDRAVFVGDLVHSPLQFAEPDCDTCLSEDQVEATRSRRRILEEAADTRSLIFPAHLPGHGAAEVRRDGDKFALSRWAPFASI
ncbi:MBL fold metallo-hydrolase [Streptomyces abikoensis]|uniref:MBL fold metallo-hydrolase n=1 Tax=Streptomyces abikoensis TaxID=97398 RepID=UPI0016798470|nr:MBL fold metallo-hydrolase [Streptomyces abikoensis]